jgi:Protein of unknown function (DUF3011)
MNMRRSAAAAAVLITGLLGFAPRVASAAQAETEAARSRSALRCESTGTYQRCPAANTWRGARLVQQISSNPCIQGRTWGFDRDAIWVNNGCRGLFDAGSPFAGPGERVTCAGSGRTECPADTRYGVTLVRKLSTSACTEGRSWGYGESVIWVDQGCRAEFQVGTAGGDGATTTGSITCGNTTGQQVTCATNGYATEVRLVRDLSNGRCREGQSWGHTDSFIWASRGCRGQFEVVLQGEAGSGQTGPTVISCGSTTGRQVVCETEGSATNVTLQRDQSNGSCRQGSTWGYTESFIWTKGGCRGEFAVAYRDGSGTGGGDATRRVTCGTSDQLRLACRPGGTVTAARLVRELSTSRCRQNSSWGFGGDSLWVGNGCIGEFSLTTGSGGGSGSGSVRTITCGSSTGQQMTCATQGLAADVRLASDMSGGRCREGESWGHTNAFVWASKGCRGRFEITYAMSGRQ